MNREASFSTAASAWAGVLASLHSWLVPSSLSCIMDNVTATASMASTVTSHQPWCQQNSAPNQLLPTCLLVEKSPWRLECRDQLKP